MKKINNRYTGQQVIGVSWAAPAAGPVLKLSK